MIERPQKLMLGSLTEYLMWEAQETAAEARQEKSQAMTPEEKKEARNRLKDIRGLLEKVQKA